MNLANLVAFKNILLVLQASTRNRHNCFNFGCHFFYAIWGKETGSTNHTDNYDEAEKDISKLDKKF